MKSTNILREYYKKYGPLVMETTLMYLKYFFKMHEDLFIDNLLNKIPENYELNSIPHILLFAYLGILLENVPLQNNVLWEDKNLEST